MGQSVGGTPAWPLPLGCRFSSGRWNFQGEKKVKEQNPGPPLPCLGLLGSSQVACGHISGPC